MTTLTFDKGVNKDLLPSELTDGVLSDALNYRFPPGFAEKFGGIAAVFTTPAVIPYFLGLYPTTSSRFLIEAGIAKVYSDDGSTQTEITRMIDPVQITGMSRTSNVVTVTTATAHNANGANITISGLADTSYNGTFTIGGAGATGFTYTAIGGDGTPTVGSGLYKINSGAATNNFTGSIDDRWTGGVLNGTFILNNPVDGLFCWNGSGKLMRLYASAASAVPLGYKADVSRPFKSFIVQLAVTISSTKYPYRVAWSNSAEPGTTPTSFTASDTNDAGDVDLAETPGFVIDCLPLGDVNVIYKQDARYAMQYIGGNDVFRFVRLPGNDGLLARGCVASTPVGHVFLTSGKDIKVHDGGEARSIANRRVKTWLQGQIDSTYASRSFLSVNSDKSEVWVCFPTSGNTTCNRALVWNWDADTWAIRELSGVTYGVTGLLPTSIATDSRMLISTSTPRIGLVDSGTTDFGSTVTGTLERTGLDLGNRDTLKWIDRVRLNVDGTAGDTLSVYAGASATADGAVTYPASPGTFTVGTNDYVDVRGTQNRFLALKTTTTAATSGMRSADLDIKGGAKR